MFDGWYLLALQLHYYLFSFCPSIVCLFVCLYVLLSVCFISNPFDLLHLILDLISTRLEKVVASYLLVARRSLVYVCLFILFGFYFTYSILAGLL